MRARVLVVDDSPTIRKVVTMIVLQFLQSRLTYRAT